MHMHRLLSYRDKSKLSYFRSTAVNRTWLLGEILIEPEPEPFFFCEESLIFRPESRFLVCGALSDGKLVVGDDS